MYVGRFIPLLTNLQRPVGAAPTERHKQILPTDWYEIVNNSQITGVENAVPLRLDLL